MKTTNILKAILLLILGSFLLVQCEKSSVNVDNGDKPDTEVPDDPDDDEDDPDPDPDPDPEPEPEPDDGKFFVYVLVNDNWESQHKMEIE